MVRFRSFWPFSRKDASTEDIIRSLYGGRDTATGINITYKTALEVATVFRCVAVLSDCVSTVPLRIFRKEGNSRLPAAEHPLYNIFYVRPNIWQDSLQYRETLMYHLALTGNAFSRIIRVRGRIQELVPIEPSRVSVRQLDDTSIEYELALSNGKREILSQKEVWHIHGPAWNGWMGDEPTVYGREPISLAIAMEQSHARFHKNGARPSGVYSVDGSLNDKQYKELRAYIDRETAGVGNTGRVLLLDRAAKWLSTAMTGVDAQHLESRKHQVEEICRLFGVLPIMVGYSDKTATYASAEQMFIAHSQNTARPLHRRFEASIRANLLTEKEVAEGYYPKFIDTELLRGAAKDRAAYYQSGINSGWMTRNEAREFEELDPIEGLSEPLSPVNMTTGNPPTADQMNNTPDPQQTP